VPRNWGEAGTSNPDRREAHACMQSYRTDEYGEVSRRKERDT
jgi:hypothetical protein